MDCKKPWSNEYVMETFSSTWVKKEYLPHMAQLLLEQEKMLLPETQSLANNALQIQELQYQVSMLPLNKKLETLFKKTPNILYEKIKERNVTKHRLQDKITKLRGDAPKTSVVAKKRYVMKCPYDGCRGYVTDAFVCETCAEETCQHCRLPHFDNHKCNDVDLVNMREILSSTMNCPRCYVPVFKAGGCDQIWCSQCHVTFSYATGKIDDGPVHNPMYFEYLASRPQGMTPIELENIACGDLPTLEVFLGHVQFQIRNNLEQQHRLNYEQSHNYFDIYRQKIHIERVALPYYSQDRVKDNVDLRVKYLIGDITIDQWCNSLLLRQKKRMKYMAILQLFQTTIVILNDIIRKIYITVIYDTNLIKEYHVVCGFLQENLTKICTIHGGTIPPEMISFGLPMR
jgi:hypothetical protein